jgi:hypothetical protein
VTCSCKWIMVTSLAFNVAAGAAQAAEPQKVLNLDGDQNGLYDDTERKALLDTFLKECPELQEILSKGTTAVAKALTAHPEDFREGATTGERPGAGSGQFQSFDVNGDSKVSINEQEVEGRHPLSLLVPTRIVKSENKIPWAIDIFPEWISIAYLQEDAPAGQIEKFVARGTLEKVATQPDTAVQPRKSEGRGGVECAANSGSVLSMTGMRDIRWDGRWCLFTFRIDGNSGTDKETVLLDINHGNVPNASSPKVWFNKDTGLSVQYVGRNAQGLDKRIMTTKNVVADGKTWNVVVCGIRYGQMFASVNGEPLSTETKQPPRFSGDWPREAMVSYLGSRSKGNMAWACDALVFGLTEPSEAMVRKMSGWAAHRLGFQKNLPDGHVYKDARPVLDEEDFPRRYVHDDEKWNAWGKSTKDKSFTRANAGLSRVNPESLGFARVFYDDFRASRVKASSSGEGDLWVGPGFNISVGVDAPLVTPGQEPNTYPYDDADQKQTLSIVKHGDRWRGSAFYSVNDLGHGYDWTGPKVFRLRCMFPKIDQKDLAGGLFPAFWSYSPDNLVWRTANRIEVDYFEFDGQNGRYLNGLSTHFHYAYLKGASNIFAKNKDSYNRFKVYGGEMTEEQSKIPGGLYVWDGQYHTWEFVIDQDVTYINVTIPDGNGGDKWVEVCRTPTAPVYLERLDLQLNYAFKAKHGIPKDGARQDFVVDWVEVLQKTGDVELVPPSFKARPTLTGSTAAGSTITCEPNLEGVTDVRYFWFADGYPLTYGPDATYTVIAADAGKPIRCMVKAVGLLDMPSAWSAVIK